MSSAFKAPLQHVTHLDKYCLRRKVLCAYRRLRVEQRVEEGYAREERRCEQELPCCWYRV